MKDALDRRACLARLERLLLARAPTRRAEGESILNALAVQLETRPHRAVVEALLCAVTALLDETGVDPPQRELAEDVTQLLHLCRDDHASARAEQGIVDSEEEEEPPVSYSLGPRASELVSFLRFQTGMAVDRIYLLLSRYLGFNIPLPDLQKIVHTLPPPVQPPLRRNSHSRR